MQKIHIPAGTPLTVTVESIEGGPSIHACAISPELQELIKGVVENAMDILTEIPVDGIARGPLFFHVINTTPDFNKLGVVGEPLWVADTDYTFLMT